MKRQDEFDTMVVLVMAQLYDAFPIEIEIEERSIAEKMGIEIEEIERSYGESEPRYNYGKLGSAVYFHNMFYSTLKWLRSERYIRAEGDFATKDVVLSKFGLAALKKAPSGLNPAATVGEMLAEAAKTVGKEAGRATIASVIGDLIGSAAGVLAKSMLS
jgi:hypothetical protein